MMRAVPPPGEMMVSRPSPHLTWYLTLNSPTVTFRTSPSRAGEPTWRESMTMMSPGRAGIALEGARLDGVAERRVAFAGALLVALLPVTFFAVLVLAEALFPVVFLVFVLLAVVFFARIVRLPTACSFSSLLLRLDGRRADALPRGLFLGIDRVTVSRTDVAALASDTRAPAAWIVCRLRGAESGDGEGACSACGDGNGAHEIWAGRSIGLTLDSAGP
jgi:hypothetical protein